MTVDRPARRMTLRQLLTHSEKCSRDLNEHLRSTLLTCISDFRDLNRPIRRRSHYPTVVALINALNQTDRACQEAMVLSDYLFQRLLEIREHARRERSNRR